MLPAFTEDAVNKTDVFLQTEFVEVILIDRGTTGLINIVIGELLTTEAVTHARLDVTVQTIISPLFNALSVYVGEFKDRLTPFLNHAKIGAAPPFVIDDVKVTGVPEQMLFAEAETVIVGVTGVVTTIPTKLLFAELPVIQVALLVSVQLIKLLLTSELSV